MMLALPEFSLSTLDTVHCMDALSLLRGLASGSVDAIITDMPYGTTACSWDTVIYLAAWWGQVKRVLKPRGVMVTTAAQPFTSALVMSNPAWFKYEWVWDKGNGSNPAMVSYQPFKIHESILVFCGSAGRYYPQFEKGAVYTRASGAGSRELLGGGFNQSILTINHGDRYPRSILKFSNARQDLKTHPTQKPVALYEYLIKTYTRPGELVLDPFSGSGTTAIAARMTGRRFICGDSSREYVEMSRKRLADTDPFMDRQITPELKQKSMFAGIAAW